MEKLRVREEGWKSSCKVINSIMPELDTIIEKLRRTQQDKDVEDKKGTQPKKYYAKDADGDEMSKSTKDKRAAHFKKFGSKPDDDDDAYKPAPGDKNAETKPSKHTKKFKKMFGERKQNTDITAISSWKKKLKKVKGVSKDMLQQLSQLPTPVITSMLNQIGMIVAGDIPLDERVYTNIHNKIKKIKNLKRKEAEFIASIDPHILGKVIQALKPMYEEDLKEAGLWDNIRAKKARGEKMRKKGEKGAPTDDQIKRAQEEIEEGKLVASNREIVKKILDDIYKKIEKELSKNKEKGIALINTLGAFVGHKVTDKSQQKNKLFLKFGDNIQEDAAVDAANLKARQAEEIERLKAKHEGEVEALKDRHEREMRAIDLQKEKETANKQIEAEREAARKRATNESYKLPNIKSSAMFSTLEIDGGKLKPKEKEQIMKIALDFNKGARNNMHGQVEVNSGRVNPAMIRKAAKLNQIRFIGKHDDLEGLKKDIAGGMKSIQEKAPDTGDAMKRYKAGKAGFGDVTHLKAKGLIPRSDGTKKKSPKYEKLDPKKDDAGDYIDDFRKSDAPQFKGKSDKKIRKMAVAAYLKDKEGK